MQQTTRRPATGVYVGQVPTRPAERSARHDASSRPRLTGRRTELARLQGALTGVRAAGGALLVSGEAGIGKTTLVAAAADHARAAGLTVLRCVGVERERTVGFSALHELLRPVLHLLPRLPGRQRATLETVFGLDDANRPAPAPDQLLVNTATLGLLEEAGADRPLLLVVEDVHWLDHSSADAIGFLVRRLEQAPIVLVATLCTGDAPLDDWAGLGMDHLPMGPLTDSESESLLDALPGPLDAPSRQRVLREAYGNPLALRELSSVLNDRDPLDDADLPPRLPLSQRLEDAYMRRVNRLPAATQRLLLVTAAGDDGPLGEVLTAARALGLSPADLAPAEAAGLVGVVSHELRFQHPLARSAVYGAAPFSARLEAHRALAAATPDPWRAAWHAAAATPGQDESVARALSAVADGARQRGAQAGASMAYERAAAVSVDPGERIRRLVEAAETARLAGRPEAAASLSATARPLLLGPSVEPGLAVRAAVTRWRLSASHGQWASRVGDLVQLAGDLAGPTGTEHPAERVDALIAAAAGIYVLQPEGGLRRRVLDALTTLDCGGIDAEQQVALLLVDPLHHAARWRSRLGELVDAVPAPNRLASAAEAIHDLPGAAALWNTATERTHEAREVSEECLTLHGQALIRVVTGDLTGALASADLAERISRDAGFFIIRSASLVAAAQAHVWSGDLDVAAAALQEAQSIAGSTPLGKTAAQLHWAAGLLALAGHRNWDAWVRLRQVTAHPVLAAWAVGDLTEAAVRTGKAAEVTGVLDRLEHDNAVYDSPHLAMLLHRSRALLADGEDAEAAYRAAIDAGSASAAPLELARTQFAFGVWLRRQRRIGAAVEPLTEALTGFDSAGARLWAERTAAELRAAGAAPVDRRPEGAGESAALLTAQELQIARLAADGLTNKEIADQIYLSHRTVGSHLYRIFPKLGLTSRAQLRDALGR
jgi:DNA-binding CsgD family transcriptional regulator/tetratricopeptide (TPR) repeat protein